MKNNNRGYLNEDYKIFYLKDYNGVDIEYHHHEFYKIVIFISGDAQYSIEGRTYNLKPWDILLIGKNELHKCNVNTSVPYERLVIWLKDDIETNDKYFKNLTNCIKSSQERNTHLLRLRENSCNIIKNLVPKILKYNKSKDPYDIALRNSFLIQALVILNKAYIKNRNVDVTDDIFYDKTTEKIMKYINDNLQESLSIDELADEFELSKHYLMRKFKKQTGHSIHNYIIQKRLIYALELMKEKSCMYEIAETAGFNEYSTFVRAFKKNYGLSPKKYFENYNKIENLNLID